MKTNDWYYQVKQNPEEISKKLKTSFKSSKRFVFRMSNDQKNHFSFRLRKRLLLPFEINTQNNLIVTGKISKTHRKNESDIALSFAQHPMARLIMYSHFLLGLIFLGAIIFNFSNNLYTYIITLILLVIGALLRYQLRMNVEKNIQEYKQLFSEIFEQ